jgi:hypothetical protein
LLDRAEHAVAGPCEHRRVANIVEHRMDPTPPFPRPPDALSPTLEQLAPCQRPAPMPACGRCRLALWFLVDANLGCYCNAMQRVVWDGVQPGVRCCDIPLLDAAYRQPRSGLNAA